MAKRKFSIKEAILYGWETLRKNLKFLLLFFAIVYVINLVSGTVLRQFAFTANQKNLTPVGFPIVIILIIIGLIVNIGVIVVSLKFIDHKKPSFQDLYKHYPLFLNYLYGSLIYGLIFVGGLILLIIPGIIFAIKYQYFGYLIIDKGYSPMDAIKKSSKMTKGNLINLFLLGLVLALINIAGLMVFQVGSVISAPIIALASAYVYRKLLPTKA